MLHFLNLNIVIFETNLYYDVIKQNTTQAETAKYRLCQTQRTQVRILQETKIFFFNLFLEFNYVRDYLIFCFENKVPKIFLKNSTRWR